MAGDFERVDFSITEREKFSGPIGNPGAFELTDFGGLTLRHRTGRQEQNPKANTPTKFLGKCRVHAFVLMDACSLLLSGTLMSKCSS